MNGVVLEDRLSKLDRWSSAGINPYPHTYEPSIRVPELVERKEEGLSVRIAGRITAMRRMGGTAFLDIVDQGSKVQLYLRSDNLGEDYSLLDGLDTGDFIGVGGTTFTTKRGEYSVNVSNVQLLAKSIRPLPEKWHGLKDIETRYRERTLDLLANPKVVKIFQTRCRAITAMRHYLDSHGFMEVEIPILQPVYGRASAAPFITRVNALGRDYYLSISPEIYLKRLIAGGLDGVYTITKNFRNERIDTSHNPEFTMMECYKAFMDYVAMMKITEEMIAHIAWQATGSTIVQYRGGHVELEPPWERLPMAEGIERYAGIKVDGVAEGTLKDMLRSKKSLNLGTDNPDQRKKIIQEMTRGELVMVLFENYVEPAISDSPKPVFVTDYPFESTPLCKLHRTKGDEGIIERFEAYVRGMELANAYTELNVILLCSIFCRGSIAQAVDL